MHNKIKSHKHRVGDSQTGQQLYKRSPRIGVKVLSTMSGYPTWGFGNGRRNSQRIRLWRLAWFGCRTLTGLGETETQLLEGTQKVVCTWGPRGKEQWPHRRRKQTYLLVLEGPLQRQEVSVSHHGDKDTGNRSSGKYFLGWAHPESTISPTKESVGSLAGSPQAKQPTGRELSPTHQQTSRLKFYWALPTRATPSSVHHQSLYQEACTILLDNLIHQRAGSRSKNYSPAACGMKTIFTERQTKWKGRGICTSWRNKIKLQRNN